MFGGWIWQALGIETLFIISAVLGLCNSAYAATIKVNTKNIFFEVTDKDLLGMLKDITSIIDKYLANKNMSNIKVDIDPLYLE